MWWWEKTPQQSTITLSQKPQSRGGQKKGRGLWEYYVCKSVTFDGWGEVRARSKKQLSPVAPLKSRSWVAMVPKMLLLTLFRLSRSSLLSPLGFSSSTTPSEEQSRRVRRVSPTCLLLMAGFCAIIQRGPLVWLDEWETRMRYLSLCCWRSPSSSRRRKLVHSEEPGGQKFLLLRSIPSPSPSAATHTKTVRRWGNLLNLLSSCRWHFL